VRFTGADEAPLKWEVAGELDHRLAPGTGVIRIEQDAGASHDLR
jgi:hypothetical protein